MTTTIAAPRLMTIEEFESLPDDGVERWLINGELREDGMTVRNHGHSRIGGVLAKLLGNWNDAQPVPRGEVLVGEAGVTLRQNPGVRVGIDVAYISAETVAKNPDDNRIIEGAPVLAVEILSPSDKHEDITEKVETYLECGVKLVWVVDPAFRTITVYRGDAEPQLFNVTHRLSGEPHLPGFDVAVKEIFE